MVEPVLDLTTRSERRRLRIRLSDIRSDKADAIEHCRAVADVARATGQRAIVAPSAADTDGTVLVVYLEGPPPGLEMRVTGDRRSL